MTPKFASLFRKYHRMIGFFLAGMMTIYAFTGVLLIFRNTDFLKYDYNIEKTLPVGLTAVELQKVMRSRDFRVTEESDTHIYFENGMYSKTDGEAKLTKKEYPSVIKKMVGLHKATTDSPLFYMNIIFGSGLLFLALSSFFMFIRQAPSLKSGLKFAVAGIVVVFIMVLVS